MEKFISYKNSKIQYWKYGNGAVPLICLHGFGQDGSRFSFLQKITADRFTLFPISLPFHAGTQWNEGLLFTQKDLYEIIVLILKENIEISDPQQVSLLGYSMGGRLALAFFEEYPSFIKNIYLAAPDGLHSNRWFWFATQTALGNRWFRQILERPHRFISLTKRLVHKRLFNAGIEEFVDYYMNNEEVRLQLYQRWTSFRKFVPHLINIKKLLVVHDIKINMLFGKTDRLIRYQTGEMFQKGYESSIRIILLDTGHHLLQERYQAAWRDLLNG